MLSTLCATPNCCVYRALYFQEALQKAVFGVEQEVPVDGGVRGWNCNLVHKDWFLQSLGMAGFLSQQSYTGFRLTCELHHRNRN